MTRRRIHRKFFAATVAATLAAAMCVVLSPISASAAAPDLVRTLGGPNHAEMMPSGMEIAPDGSIVIADTGNNQVAKYTTGGTEVWRVGSYGTGNGQFWNPRDIAITNDGTIYVDDTRNNRVVMLRPSDGAWLGTFGGPTGNKISFALGVSAAGTGASERIYVADSGKNKVRVFDPQPPTADGTITRDTDQVAEFKLTSGACTFQDVRDADADADGNIYIANYKAHNVVKLSPTGACLDSWATGTQTNNTPYGISVANDPGFGGERVYVALGNEDRIEVWSKNGDNLLKSFGGDGTVSQPGTFMELRRVAVAADGDVWGADLWGWRLERWDRTATDWVYAQTIGAPLPTDTATRVFQEPRGIAFENDGTVNVIDTVHHRMVRMNPTTGAIVSICGKRGSNVGQYNWPRGQAVDPATGQVWVANTKQYNIHIINPLTCGGAGNGAKFGTFGAQPGQFNWPHDVAIRGTDRIAFIADTNNHRIVAYNVATRAYISAFGTMGSGTGQFRFPTAVDINPLNGRLLVADSQNNRIVELSDNGGNGMQVTRTFTGGFNRPMGVAADATGNIYVADTLNDRVVILSPTGVVLESFAGPGGLNDPEAVSIAPNGEIYVADTFNDRIRVFAAYGGGGGGPDTIAPNGTLTVPTPNQVFTSTPVQMNGTATDNVGVAVVQVGVKDRTTGLWLRGNGTWGTFQAQNTTLASPNATTTTWTFAFVPPSGGSGLYAVQVIAKDGAGLVDPTKPWVQFSIT